MQTYRCICHPSTSEPRKHDCDQSHLTECGRCTRPSDTRAPAGCSASSILSNARASECRPPCVGWRNRKYCVGMLCLGGLGICSGAGNGLGPQLDHEPASDGVRVDLKELRQSPRPRLSMRSCCAKTELGFFNASRDTSVARPAICRGVSREANCGSILLKMFCSDNLQRGVCHAVYRFSNEPHTCRL